MTSFKRTTVTAALPYANGPLHIGHIAGCYLPSDIYVKYLKASGQPVLFICGSDEHGVGISIKAAAEGLTPKELVDKYHPMMDNAFKSLGIDFDFYSRTTDPIHYQTAQEFFLELYKNDKFIKKVTEQFYDVDHQQFLADRYIYGTCPNCGNDKAYGDQCENCGKSLDPFDLIDPKSALSNKTPEKRFTEHFYLPLDQYENWLTEFILDSPEKQKNWKNNVYGQCKSWISQGMHPRAITRDLTWGVPVPLPDAEGKKLYVWFDAPIGYISATKKWAQANNTSWEEWWKDDQTRLIHFIGKDNIVFHCIIFPVMLHAHGGFVLPDNVPANEFLNIEGQKISTSRNWAVWVHEYLIDLPDHQDALRYTLCANAPESKDNDFTWKDFQAKNNNELSAILGNLINRINVLTHKFYEGMVPEISTELSTLDLELVQAIADAPKLIADCIENFKFREALNIFMDLARAGNKYLTETEPWKSIKIDENKTKTTIHLGIQLIANLSILANPFIPFASKKIQSALGLQDFNWHLAGGIDLIKPGSTFQKMDLLFQPITDEMVEIQTEKLNRGKQQKLEEENSQNNSDSTINYQALKPNIEFDDFAKIDLRVVTILEAQKVKGADKLLQFTVDLGFEKRSVVSGVALHLSPEEMIGKQVVLVANLAPRKIKGVESQGMILYPETPGGQLKLLCPYTEVEAGSVVA
jgi:methionyl-tRNA synthetase